MLSLWLISVFNLNSQIINKQINQSKNLKMNLGETEINANELNTSIITKVLYNAIPEGYYVTFTTTFIGKSINEVDSIMNLKIDSLISKVVLSKILKMNKKDIVIDLIALDPVFNFNASKDSLPMGYKITQNITFNVKNISFIPHISKTCLDYHIYDLLEVQPYIGNTDLIYDSLAKKTIDILDEKKKLVTAVGISLKTGSISCTNYKDVFYPSERYLHSYIKNLSLYKHDLTQNSEINMERNVDVNHLYNLNLKDADFVYNANATGPVIQFYYQLNYNYVKKDTEAEMREKIRKEEASKPDKVYYILDKEGKLKKVDLE